MLLRNHRGPLADRELAGDASPAPAADPGEGAYGAPFWLTYANNLCLMTAVSMLFRYADFVHALGTLGTLGLLVFLTGQVMAFVIHGASGEAVQIALYIATLVLTPLLFLGAAHLYADQVARAEVESKPKVDKEA